jgi:hypothetical protein
LGRWLAANDRFGVSGPDLTPPVPDLLRAAARVAWWPSSPPSPPRDTELPPRPRPSPSPLALFSFVLLGRGWAGGRLLRRDARVAFLDVAPCFPKHQWSVTAFPPLGCHGCDGARVPTWARWLTPRRVPLGGGGRSAFPAGGWRIGQLPASVPACMPPRRKCRLGRWHVRLLPSDEHTAP